MKKQSLKNTLAAIAALFIAIIALPTTAQAQVQTMKILGKAYYEDAVVDIGGGTATWDKANATLTLDGINVESYKGSFIYCNNIPNLKIVLAGNNTVNCTSNILYSDKGNVEISGKGSLTASTTGHAAIKHDDRSPSTLTIKDCMLDVQGAKYCIMGFLNGPNTAALSLVVDNATLKVKSGTGGGKYPGFYGLKAYELRGCHIETPGVKFGREDVNSTYQLLDKDNKTYYGEVSIVPDDATVGYEVTITTDTKASDGTTNGNLATLVLPRATVIPEGIKAYIIVAESENAFNAKEVSGILPANTPILILGKAGSYIFKTTSDAGDATAFSGNMLLGTGEDGIDVKAERVYVLTSTADGKAIFATTEAMKLPKRKAYLAVGIGFSPKSIIFNSTTGLHSATTGQNVTNIYYDLQGRRISRPNKGIVIMNGHKVAIKH